jgi:hypothetical protein
MSLIHDAVRAEPTGTCSTPDRHHHDPRQSPIR